MAKKKAKNYKKSMDDPTRRGPTYRTSKFFRGSKFSGGGKPKNANIKFNPAAQVKTQHRG